MNMYGATAYYQWSAGSIFQTKHETSIKWPATISGFEKVLHGCIWLTRGGSDEPLKPFLILPQLHQQQSA